jgi:hypothetical protein
MRGIGMCGWLHAYEQWVVRGGMSWVSLGHDYNLMG